MYQKPVEFKSFQRGSRVCFVGIGKGNVMDFKEIQGVRYLSVKFDGAPKEHLCRPEELELVKLRFPMRDNLEN